MLHLPELDLQRQGLRPRPLNRRVRPLPAFTRESGARPWWPTLRRVQGREWCCHLNRISLGLGKCPCSGSWREHAGARPSGPGAHGQAQLRWQAGSQAFAVCSVALW